MNFLLFPDIRPLRGQERSGYLNLAYGSFSRHNAGGGTCVRPRVIGREIRAHASQASDSPRTAYKNKQTRIDFVQYLWHSLNNQIACLNVLAGRIVCEILTPTHTILITILAYTVCTNFVVLEFRVKFLNSYKYYACLLRY